jgi:predicted alpha-1,2-mannosidase
MKNTLSIFMMLILAACTNHGDNDVLTLVNPFIGTDGHGHTFPGASVPFGMVQLSPDTRKDNWDACSGYHYSDTAILGFSHTHLSGTGVGDYGDIRFMPMVGELEIRPVKINEAGKGYYSKFSHKKEEASPGYYQVFLEDYGINAEFTVTERCGLHQYTFPKSDNSRILIDLKESVVSESYLELYVKIINDQEISGYRRSSGWASNQVVFFHAIFSRPFDEYGTAEAGIITPGSNEAKGADVQAFVEYKTGKNEKVFVKVGISAVSMDGARKNLEAEMPGWDFNQVKNTAQAAWRNELSRIEVKDDNREDLVKFYTALYHCYLAPNLFSDSDRSYRGHDSKIYKSDGADVYTVFSLWDTYRALHPLLTIVQQERTRDIIRTFLEIYKKGGLLPVWELAGNETNCMIGYHAVPVIVDAYIKGITDFDAEKAFTAMKTSASHDQFGLKYYREYGYIPAEAEGEAISKTLEYAYDDWCIAMMAKKLGYEDDYRYYIRRAQSYKNIFDPDSRFLRGKRNGMFTKPFDPTEVNFMLTEANTWQYTFYVPQDISGLSKLTGGDVMFEKKLDEMFDAAENLSGRQQSDITGLIGQYAHGNEPSHHMAYLFNYVGKPAKTQKLVRQIMDELYGAGPSGLCGNEDCGQMSAWFVMSAMGFYPVTPCSGYYAIGSPLFEKVTLHLENGNDFVIECENNRGSNIYIQSAWLNGTNFNSSYITHDQIMNGGLLKFTMGEAGNTSWGQAPESLPSSAIQEYLIAPVPFFEAESGSFQDSLQIRIRHLDKNAVLYYMDTDPKKNSEFKVFTSPITTREAVTLNAYARLESTGQSIVAKAAFNQIHNDWKVSIMNPYSAQYTGGGDMALIDGQRGGPNFRTDSWQGYQGVDFEAVIDMGKETDLKKVSASFLQDQRSWIFMPVKVEFSVSKDGINFKLFATVENDFPDDSPEAVIRDFGKSGVKESGRYLKIEAINRKACPPWHVGAGDKAWIFTDEISVE